jgi:hypothetical protein
MQRVEIRIAVNAEDEGRAIDAETLLSVSKRSLGNPGEALGSVVAASGDQPHTLAIALHPHAIAIELYFVKPFRARLEP